VPIRPAAALASMGGTAPYRRLVGATGRSALRTAVRRGEVVRLRRGRYGLPRADDALSTAIRSGGCLSHVSAALHHRWGVLRLWDATCVTLPRATRPGSAPAVRWSYAPLSDAEREAGVTSPVRTVLDCARTLPFDEALAVADSALRSGDVLPDELDAAARTCRSPGVRRAREILRHADARAANPFESALRAVVLQAGLTGFIPQLVIAEDGLFACVDLGDPDRRVAFEADGYGVHGTRAAFAKDLARHDELQSEGWVTRRFAYEHVLYRQGWVARQVLSAARQQLVRRPQRHKRRPYVSRKAA
jgi:very-short-patch-repair endonuclease